MNKIITGAIVKRILSSVIVMFLVITFVFFLVRMAPGNPAQKFLSPGFSPQLAEQVTKSFNLDKTPLQQYFAFLKNLCTGDFGTSYTYRQPVLQVLSNFLAFTILFSLTAFIIQAAISFLLAIKSVKNINGPMDKLADKISLFIFATPSFVTGLLLILVFSVQLDLFPTSGIKSLDNSELPFFSRMLDYVSHLILPLATLTAGGIAIFYRYQRDNLNDIYNHNFILNLRSMGYDENTILKKHVFPNTLGPFLSIAGIELGILLGGALITEVIFGLPGIGRLTVSAIFERDYPLVIGCTFAAAALMIISNLIADLVKIKIDKRLVKDLLQ